MENPSTWVNLKTKSVLGEGNEGEFEPSENLKANFLDVILLEFRLFIEPSLAEFQISQRFQLVLDLDVYDLNDLTLLLLVS